MIRTVCVFSDFFFRWCDWLQVESAGIELRTRISGGARRPLVALSAGGLSGTMEGDEVGWWWRRRGEGRGRGYGSGMSFLSQLVFTGYPGVSPC